MSAMPDDELVADVCRSCGTLVNDWEAHGRHHADLGVLAAVLTRHVDSHQGNRLTLASNLTISGGIPAA
jgi:hypothetical protein